MYELVLKTDFAAAHNLREYHGNCERLHGHNWHIEVRLRAAKLNKLGMVMDFRDVKRVLKDVTDRLDHRYLNELEPFRKANPTTENIARFIFDGLAKALPKGVKPASVTSWESRGCGVTYYGKTEK